MVTHAHYRNILHASASQPRPLTPTGQPCVTITLQGASFMVHALLCRGTQYWRIVGPAWNTDHCSSLYRTFPQVLNTCQP